MEELPGEAVDAQRLQEVAIDDPVIEEQRVVAAENLDAEINTDQPHSLDQGANFDADLTPTLGGVVGAEGMVSSPLIVDTNYLASQDVREEIFNTPQIVQKRPQEIPVEEDSEVIDIQVQSVPISAISPRGKNLLINEVSNNQPQILKRNKNKETTGQQDYSCILTKHQPNTTRQEKEVHGPRVSAEPTRQEKKRLLLESTKARRKIRKQAQLKGVKAGPKATLTNNGGLVEIQVEFQHCSRIAEAAGFQTAQVISAIKEDNEERAHVLSEHDPNYVPEDNTSVFDPQSEDEDDSDAE